MKPTRRKLATVVVEQLQSGKSSQEVAKSLAAYLVEHNMTSQVELLINDIARLLAEQEGHVLAEVTSAFGLNDQTRTAIRQYLQKTTGAKQIELTESVDPGLIGGFRLRVPGQELDASVKRKLNQLVTE